MLWALALLDGQVGFAADLTFEYERVFGADQTSQIILNEAASRLKKLVRGTPLPGHHEEVHSGSNSAWSASIGYSLHRLDSGSPPQLRGVGSMSRHDMAALHRNFHDTPINSMTVNASHVR